jgi:hypothetical protein
VLGRPRELVWVADIVISMRIEVCAYLNPHA